MKYGTFRKTIGLTALVVLGLIAAAAAALVIRGFRSTAAPSKA